MAKSRRKKNYKLRRRVMRTVAALTMIMAVVVAAIPVENYGTMRAAAGTQSAGHDDTVGGINDQPAKYDSANYENSNSYNSYTDTITVERIQDDANGRKFTEVFEGKSNGTNVIITKDIVGEYGGNLALESQEYYNYVQFDSRLTDAVSEAFYDNGTAKTFQVEFEDESSGSLNFSQASSNGFTLDSIDIKKIVSDRLASTSGTTLLNPINASSTPDKTQGYNSFGTVSLNANELFEKFTKTEYDQRKTDIATYNTKIDNYRNELSSIYAKVSSTTESLTATDRDRWNTIKNELESDYARLKSFKKAYNEFPIDGDSNLNSVLEYTIRHYCKKGSTALDAGDHYKLIALQSANGQGTVYVPKNIDNLVPNEFKDANGYMASGQVTVIGIASNAFTGTKLTGVTIPETIRFIGKEAFANSNLQDVTIHVNACEIIGENAFNDCSSLKTVNFDGTANSFTIIDKKAFANTAIENITIPSSISTVGAGAFENIPALTSVRFSAPGKTDGIDIEPYAFYNCVGLSQVTFDDSERQYKIKRGAFALAAQGGEAMGSFVFPKNNNKIIYGNVEDDYDYILANRSGLKSVIFPGEMTGEVPDHTLAGLGNNIEYVKFPDNAQAATYDPQKLFADIYNPDFYVEGPESNGTGGYSEPRRKTWEAKAGELGTNEWRITSVPYTFKDSNGVEHWEIGVIDEVGKPPKYIANIEKISESEAKLVSYFPYDATAPVGEYVWIKIPTNVGPYQVVSIEKGCFDDAPKLKEKVSRLTIGDSVKGIEAGAFKEMPKLQWVDIGSAVANIESEAFAGCEELENVVFSQVLTSTFNENDVEYWGELKIADDAFKTNSERLTFHGAVNPNYAPFKLAMSANNSDLLSTDAQICYKTDAPLNLTIIRNRRDGKATLVDYPHYEEMDSGDKTLFESIYIRGTESDQTKLDTDAGKKILQTLKMELPSGIESIDTKSFFAASSGNNPDFNYIDYHYEHYYGPAGSGASPGADQEKSNHVWSVRPDRGIDTNDSSKDDIKKIYSEDAYVEDTRYAEKIGDTAYEKNDPENEMIVSIGGLFSGGFKEAKDHIDTEDAIWGETGNNSNYTYENHTYKEMYPSGNDYLTSINLRGVIELPDYAFDSCENLLTVGFNAVQSMGNLPFRGCTNLYNIDPGNSNYAYENMLLYEKKSDGSTEIVECLEGRGKGQGDNGHYYYTGSITGTGEGSNVDNMISTASSIREGAFSNCVNIRTVNLETSKVDRIPQRAFENCTKLWQVILPETVRGIDQKAFKNAADDGDLYVTIKNPNCTIAVDAFDFDSLNEVFITGISTDDKGNESVCHYNYEQIKKELEKDGKDGNRIHWSELGSTCVLTFEDEIGNIIDTIEIEKGATLRNPPTAPIKTGYVFDYWICTGVRDENGNPLTGAATYSDVTEDRTIRAIYKEDPTTIVPDGNDYNLTVASGKAMINGTLISTFPTPVKGGTPVTIMANDETNFKVWTIEPGTYISLLLNPSSPATSFTMPNADITVTANTAIGGSTDTPNPDGTYTVTVNNGTGGGNYRPGATVTITANTATGQTFTNWTTATAGVSFANANTATTTFVMPSAHVTVTANYSGGSGTNTPNPDGTYTVTVNNGTGGGNYRPGATVTITANAAPTGQSFTNWTTSTTGVSLANANSNSTTFVMPSSNVTVTANFSGGSSTGKYKVTVNYGSGSGEYSAGETVNITANAPESSSRVFSRWTTNNSGLGFANANAVSTSFVMPAADVTVTANYRTRTDEDDDDDSPSRRPGTNTNTTTVNNRPGSSTSTTGTNGTVNNPVNGTTNNNGNRIYITKNGISNTDVASLAVSGSTDNFIVRITESPEATAAVEQALTNAYGSLNGLAYLPMDISLYDSTGQNKITDSTGLNITVTMPIPDVLIQYGGNARVAAADNGNLQQLTPRFTTIDGIACISFVPPHFSPYVIYVDTNNLIAGQMLDSTPATGDPIHPKWFAAIGMACVSILLFVLSDGRKRKHYRAA